MCECIVLTLCWSTWGLGCRSVTLLCRSITCRECVASFCIGDGEWIQFALLAILNLAVFCARARCVSCNWVSEPSFVLFLLIITFLAIICTWRSVDVSGWKLLAWQGSSYSAAFEIGRVLVWVLDEFCSRRMALTAESICKWNQFTTTAGRQGECSGNGSGKLNDDLAFSVVVELCLQWRGD